MVESIAAAVTSDLNALERIAVGSALALERGEAEAAQVQVALEKIAALSRTARERLAGAPR